MKIAIISDSHDNIPNLKKTLSFIENEEIKIILHCGDICSPLTLKSVFNRFKGKIYIVFGNADPVEEFRKSFAQSKIFWKSSTRIDPVEEFKRNFFEKSNIKIFGEKGEVKIGGKKITFCHFPELANSLASTGKYDLVFYGHTHKPWEERINHTRLINPGNLSGLFYKATFAIYDTKSDKIELKILEKLNCDTNNTNK